MQKPELEKLWLQSIWLAVYSKFINIGGIKCPNSTLHFLGPFKIQMPSVKPIRRKVLEI